MAYEPVSPPDSGPHYYLPQQKPQITINANDQRKLPQGVQENAPAGDANMVLKFVHHRIAEAMRNDEKFDHEKDGRRSLPGNGIPENDGDKKRASPSVYISPSTRPPSQQPPFQTSFMYPFSALTIPQVGANPIISPKAANELIDANRQSTAQPQHLETRQVLSENYDALSDED
jgi:hypothetical protein